MNSTVLPLSEVILLQRGFDLPIQDRKIGTIPVVASTGVVGSHHEAKVDGPGVVIGRSGSIGGAQFIKGNFWPLNTTLWVKDFKGNDPQYIYYLLKSMDFTSYNAGSGVPTLNRNHLSSIRVYIPRLDNQRKIAEILSSLDEKIELNRKMNKTLEEIGQALFKHWFIDNPEKETWSEKHLSDIVTIRYGKNLPTKLLKSTGYPVFGGNGQIGYYEKYLYIKPQVLVSCRGEASGKVNISLPNSFVTNNSLVLDISNSPEEISYEWLRYYSLSRDDGYREFVSGSAQPQITIDSLVKCKIPLPPRSLMAEFSELIRPFEDKKLHLDEVAKNLIEIRDSLLPRLMSGKLKL